jgi:hypothetical protein
LKNASKAIREAYYTALNGNISYGGNNVPVYKNVPVQTMPDHFIEIASIDEVNELNDHKWMRECILTLEVVSTQYQFRDYTVVDEISEDVQQIIIATIGGSLTDTNFQIGHIQVESSRYLNETDGNRFITRKILQFNQTLIQK